MKRWTLWAMLIEYLRRGPLWVIRVVLGVPPACLFESDERTFLELIYRRKIMPPIVHIPGTCKSLDVARLRIPFGARSDQSPPSG